MPTGHVMLPNGRKGLSGRALPWSGAREQGQGIPRMLVEHANGAPQ